MIVPLLILLCCILHILFRKSRKKGLKAPWDFTSTQALRRRSSILALSTIDLTENDLVKTLLPQETNNGPLLNDQSPMLYVHSPSVDSHIQFSTVSPESSRASMLSDSTLHSTPSQGGTKKPRRKYDGVYRTNEPLPGKPLIEFEDKVWDLEDEYRVANDRVMRLAEYDKKAASGSSRIKVLQR